MSLTDLAREALGSENGSNPPADWTDAAWETASAADLTAQTAKVLHLAHSREETRNDLFRSGVAAGAVAVSNGARGFESRSASAGRSFELHWSGTTQADC